MSSYADKLRTINTVSRLSKNHVREGMGEHGRWKATTDENGNTVTDHAEGDRRDVHVRPSAVRVATAVKPKE